MARRESMGDSMRFWSEVVDCVVRSGEYVTEYISLIKWLNVEIYG